MRSRKSSDSPSDACRDFRWAIVPDGACVSCHEPERKVKALGMCGRCHQAARRAQQAALKQGLVIAPEGYDVGHTISGGATHAGKDGKTLCGRYFDLAWGRVIDRANLPVSCNPCIRTLRKTTVEVFLTMSALQPNGCRLWGGGHVPRGYGVTNDAHGRRVYVHRLAWELANGREIPPGMVVMHSCDNPPCCNPDHLSLGTLADNNADMAAKGRSARGERAARAKLSNEQAEALRAYGAAGASVPKLAVLYGISTASVRRILRHETYIEVAA